MSESAQSNTLCRNMLLSFDISSPDDKCETLKRRISELVIFEDGLKRTALLPMIEFHLGKPACIDGDRSLSSGGLQELFFVDEQELRLRVNEPSNKRSEERRVGKECSSRWSPGQYK